MNTSELVKIKKKHLKDNHLKLWYIVIYHDTHEFLTFNIFLHIYSAQNFIKKNLNTSKKNNKDKYIVQILTEI